jgi:hypothetical protein
LETEAFEKTFTGIAKKLSTSQLSIGGMPGLWPGVQRLVDALLAGSTATPVAKGQVINWFQEIRATEAKYALNKEQLERLEDWTPDLHWFNYLRFLRVAKALPRKWVACTGDFSDLEEQRDGAVDLGQRILHFSSRPDSRVTEKQTLYVKIGLARLKSLSVPLVQNQLQRPVQSQPAVAKPTEVTEIKPLAAVNKERPAKRVQPAYQGPNQAEFRQWQVDEEAIRKPREAVGRGEVFGTMERPTTRLTRERPSRYRELLRVGVQTLPHTQTTNAEYAYARLDLRLRGLRENFKEGSAMSKKQLKKIQDKLVADADLALHQHREAAADWLGAVWRIRKDALALKMPRRVAPTPYFTLASGGHPTLGKGHR